MDTQQVTGRDTDHDNLSVERTLVSAAFPISVSGTEPIPFLIKRIHAVRTVPYF